MWKHPIKKNENDKLQTGRKHLQVTYLTKELYVEYIKKSQNSMLKNRTIQLEKGKQYERTFLNRICRCQAHKKCSTPLGIRDANKNDYIISLRMAKIKNSNNTKCWQDCGETGSLIHGWWELRLYNHCRK